VVILSLADPARPVEIGRIQGESHDMYAKGDRLFVLTQRRGTVEIWNAANPASPQKLGVIDLAGKSRELGEIEATANTVAHNAWPSEDGKTLFTTEEIRGTYGKSWDISNPAAPRYLGRYIGVQGVYAHNFYVKGERMYVAHHAGGFRVVDIRDPANMTELAWHKASNGGNSWGAYPWFKSGNLIYGDERLGLFVVRETSPAGLSPGKISPLRFRGEIKDGMVRFHLPQAGPYAFSILTLDGRELFRHRGLGKKGKNSLPTGMRMAKGMHVLKWDSPPHDFLHHSGP
jgi:hypothetical protein